MPEGGVSVFFDAAEHPCAGGVRYGQLARNFVQAVDEVAVCHCGLGVGAERHTCTGFRIVKQSTIRAADAAMTAFVKVVILGGVGGTAGCQCCVGL